MKAAIFDQFGSPLRIGDVSDPTPEPDEVVLKVSRCGICGSDLHMTVDDTFGLQGGEVIGHEFAGEVVALGKEVASLKVGDLVAAAPLKGCGTCGPCLKGEPAWCENSMELIGGGYAEYAALVPRQLRKLPLGIGHGDGALAEPLAVALHGIIRSGMKPGDRVLVVGAGAIGLAVVFWARRMGASAIVAADLHDYQKDRAVDLGATEFLLIDHCIDLVRPRGTVCVLGLCTGTDRLDSFRAISKEVNVIMSVFFDMHEFATSIDALESGRYQPQALISDVVNLDGLPTAFEALRDRTHQCKVLIDPFG